MDSLLANYASSDEEEQEEQQQKQSPPPSQAIGVGLPSLSSYEITQTSSSRAASLFFSLPKPKSSSFFQSLPRPKQSASPALPTSFFEDNNEVVERDAEPPASFSVSSPKSSSLSFSIPQSKQNPLNLPSSQHNPQIDVEGDDGEKPAKLSSVLSSLPPPKFLQRQHQTANSSSSEPQTKKVVQFKPPVNIFSTKLSEDDDGDDTDEEDRERKRRKESESLVQTPSVMTFLSSIPAPKNSTTLGTLSSSSSGRRSIVETEVPISHTSDLSNGLADAKRDVDQSSIYDGTADYDTGTDQNAWSYENYNIYGNYHSGIDQNVDNQVQSGLNASDAGYYGNYENYGNHSEYQQYGSTWSDGSAMMATEMTGTVESTVKISEKRRRNEIPTEIIEVKQDELIKNRPREDQVKLTGIAFGPSYQPTSTKGKPSKLHKRKHQIGSLYFDMRQKEMELAERRAKGLLTKAETQAKYGW